MQPFDLELTAMHHHLKLRKAERGTEVWCPVRRRWVVFEPEEMVRQLLIQRLVATEGYPLSRLSVERGLQVNSLQRRFDLLVYDPAVQPFLLVECKAPSVPIAGEGLRQLSNYNHAVRAPYLLITNGIDSFCFEMHYRKGKAEPLPHLPPYPA
ncbi:MAG: type I restriction enzyme HsdR N-terminal domain-containing protein [Bacteroidetes bacterium]|nr:MAG: type I restriction enzyme HsdR N-terminal domain-containing protein [Bacteroidota bacterium]